VLQRLARPKDVPAFMGEENLPSWAGKALVGDGQKSLNAFLDAIVTHAGGGWSIFGGRLVNGIQIKAPKPLSQLLGSWGPPAGGAGPNWALSRPPNVSEATQLSSQGKIGAPNGR